MLAVARVGERVDIVAVGAARGDVVEAVPPMQGSLALPGVPRSPSPYRPSASHQLAVSSLSVALGGVMALSRFRDAPVTTAQLLSQVTSSMVVPP